MLLACVLIDDCFWWRRLPVVSICLTLLRAFLSLLSLFLFVCLFVSLSLSSSVAPPLFTSDDASVCVAS